VGARPTRQPLKKRSQVQFCRPNLMVYVARMYARMPRDLRDATHTAPSFEDAVVVHRVIAAIERAAESGSRTVLA
jgi:predicted dehydrogenase